MTKIEEYIKANEGWSAVPYQDTRGIWTGGWGFNFSIGIPPKVAQFWLEYKIEEAFLLLIKNIRGFIDLPENVRMVLIDMTYNMGLGGLLTFKKMLIAIEEGDYKKASEELMDSEYARQVPNRALKNRDLLEK